MLSSIGQINIFKIIIRSEYVNLHNCVLISISKKYLIPYKLCKQIIIFLYFNSLHVFHISFNQWFFHSNLSDKVFLILQDSS